MYFFISKSNNKIFVPTNEHLFEHTFFLRYGIIFPKVLLIRIFRFLRKYNYVILNIVKFKLQSIIQQKDIENGILLSIFSGIFSSWNAPNYRPLFFGFDASLNHRTTKIGIFRLF